MYLSFYNLLAKPFAIQPDPFFLWLGPKQADALSMLRHALLEDRGLVLLTGDAGLGKTTLIQALAGGPAGREAWAVLGDPSLERLDFYNAIARGFGLDREVVSKVQFLLQFNAFLQKARDDGKRVVLAVDDCHRLSQEMLEELHLLANIEKDGAGLINILLAGRGEFLETLSRPGNRAVRQRLTLKVELVPLTRGETGDYIRHRLQVAGAAEEIFTAKAVEVIHLAGRGNPRLINMICDETMVVGAAAGNRPAGPESVEECLVRLDIPPPFREEVPVSAGGDEGGGPKAAEKGTFGLPVFRSVGAWRWVMAGLGIVLIGVAGLSLLQPGDIGETPPGKDLPVVQQSAGRERPPDTTFPVGKLEPIGKAIEFDGVKKQRQTILRRGGEGQPPAAGGIKEEPPAAPVPEHPESEVAPPAPEPENAPVVPSDEGQVAEEIRQAPAERLPSENLALIQGAGKPGVEAAEPSSKSGEPKEQTVEGEGGGLAPPPPPAKITLPLRPNSLELTDEAAREYREFLERMKNHPEAKLVVKGFVSAKTNSPENVKLSEERALGVRKLLVDSGIEPARITVKGMGNQEPIASNDTSEGRAKNRRVEIEVEQ